jgi:hypothetical protein
LPPRHRCPLTWLPASRLLLPRSGLERSDFVPWREADIRQDITVGVCSTEVGVLLAG